MFEKRGNLATQEQFGEAINTGNLDAFDELVAQDCVDHDPAPGQEPGPAGYKAFFGEMRTAFPDLAVDVDTILAEGEQVAFAYTLTGTHRGPFQGHGPTERQIKVRGLQISRFADGKMVERWGSTDEIGILTQLGLA